MLLKKPLVIGHRGAAGHQPENTLASVEAAIELGSEMVEIDVHCVEGELFAFHDRRLERLTGTQGRFARLTIADLKRLRVQGHEIPSLRDVVKQINRRAALNIEIKGHSCADAVVKIASSMMASGWSRDQILVSSFDHVQLHQIRAADPRIPLGVLMECRPFDLAGAAKRLGAYSIHCGLSFVTEDYVKDAHAHGLKFMVYTVNHEEDVRELIDLGVDGIISDYPDMVRAIVDGCDENRAA